MTKALVIKKFFKKLNTIILFSINFKFLVSKILIKMIFHAFFLPLDLRESPKG